MPLALLAKEAYPGSLRARETRLTLAIGKAGAAVLAGWDLAKVAPALEIVVAGGALHTARAAILTRSARLIGAEVLAITGEAGIEATDFAAQARASTGALNTSVLARATAKTTRQHGDASEQSDVQIAHESVPNFLVIYFTVKFGSVMGWPFAS